MVRSAAAIKNSVTIRLCSRGYQKTLQQFTRKKKYDYTSLNQLMAPSRTPPPSLDNNDDDVTPPNDKGGEHEEGKENNYKMIERNELHYKIRLEEMTVPERLHQKSEEVH